MRGSVHAKAKIPNLIFADATYTNLNHRLLLLKLDKQIDCTIYPPILAANEARHMEGVGCHIGGAEVQ